MPATAPLGQQDASTQKNQDANHYKEMNKPNEKTGHQEDTKTTTSFTRVWNTCDTPSELGEGQGDIARRWKRRHLHSTNIRTQ